MSAVAVVSGQLPLLAGDEWADLRGLTGHALWFHSMVRGWKRIENRSTALPAALVGRPIAFHAGATYDDPRKWAECALRRVLGREVDPATVRTRAVIGVVFFGQPVTSSPDPFFFGPFGWPVVRMVPIDPVPCNGALGLWRVPADVKALVRERFTAADA